MYTLQFESEEGKKRFLFCYEGIVAPRQEGPSPDKWDLIIDLLRKIRAAGKPTGEKAGRIEVYMMEGEKQTVQLSSAERTLLLSFVESSIWPVIALEDVRDTTEWIRSLEDKP